MHEILKNAVRATVEHHSGPNFPVVNVGIFQGKFDVLIKVCATEQLRRTV